MPDPTPLTATPSSARALAAAGAGETVTLRVPFADQPPEGLKISYSGVFGWSAVDADGRIYSFRRPVARGERVVIIPKLWGRYHGGGTWSYHFGYGEAVEFRFSPALGDRMPRRTDKPHTPAVEGKDYPVTTPPQLHLHATVLATPAPEKCETCEDGKVWECDDHLCWMAVCPDCVGRLWGWRVEVRREGSDQWLT